MPPFSQDIENFSRDPQHHSEEETLSLVLEKLNELKEIAATDEVLQAISTAIQNIESFGAKDESITTLTDAIQAQGVEPLATEETLQSIADSQYVSSNIDTTDATNYYFLSFIPGTTKWRINRLNKTTYVSDYATGEGDIETAWADRTTQTYSTIY